ncbi:MAG: type IIL restriction-modification enzyme MmeI, partial [Verrucomicrobiae bacterium]
MPHLSWNEVRDRAIKFSRRWKETGSERSEKQTFWNEFFDVFGIRRASIASFEENVRNLRGNTSAIDLLWRGRLLVEHKSRGADLSVAATQAFTYIEDLTRENRWDEVPRFVLVSDFANFVLYDLEPEEQLDLPLFAGRPIAPHHFALADFPRHIRAFAFMLGQSRVRLDPEDPANEKAYARMCGLHDSLVAGGFSGHELERLLCRVLFCLFAEDNLIFQPEAFTQFVRTQTRPDGSDLAAKLNELFDWLNNPLASSSVSDTDWRYGFRYVNGGLFAERLGFPIFTKAMREALSFCCDFQWGKISPAVFGSLFQGVLEDRARRQQGAHYTSERDIIWGDLKAAGILDYVTCWYRKAADYIQGTNLQVAFVSTNSISQGEQVGLLWEFLFSHYTLKIQFAHRTFSWESEARGKAHVHVVIIGFGTSNRLPKFIYDYVADTDKATFVEAENISPYLAAGGNLTLRNRSKPISDVPEAQFGCMPNDDGNLLFNDVEKSAFLAVEPQAAPLFRPFLSAHEYFHGESRWCLWLADAEPALIRRCPKVIERIEAVRSYRLSSTREATRKLAAFPGLFGEIRAPSSQFVLLPRHSSENRAFIPFSYFEPSAIPADSCLFLEDAEIYHFGVLSSVMHMAWVKQVCGRLKSDYRYSAGLVYNNYPWPSPTPEQRAKVEACAAAVLAAREPHLPPRGMSTLADLYDPLTMPVALSKAHADLDRAVEKCYRPEPFRSDRERVEHLFRLYEQLTAPLLP